MYMDEYLKGVVPSEVGASWPYDSLCAQAVAARCFASTADRHPEEGADVCTTTHCQVWRPERDDRTDVAVDSTHNVAALYDGQIVSAFYFGHCDGHTRDSEDVWGGYLPYCRSVPCPCGFTSMYGHGVGMCQEGARVLANAGWDYRDILKHYYSGVEVRSTEPAPQRWYFAEGTTREGFTTYFCLSNPGAADAAVKLRYMMESGGDREVDVVVQAGSRLTVDAATDVGAGKDFACEITSENGVPVVAERPMYFSYKGAITGGHDALGSNYPRPTWYFAEGTTREGFDTYLCVANPADTAVDFVVSYYLEGGGTKDVLYKVSPRARKTVEPTRDIGREKDFSCRVESAGGAALIAERPMYFDYQGAITGGHDAPGALSARSTWYFAEGSTRPGFETYLCIGNPTGHEAEVEVSYLMNSGDNRVTSHKVGPMTRKTIRASDEVGSNKDFACRVNCPDGSNVVVERPMYFVYQGDVAGGSDTLAAPNPKPLWQFAEGTTRPGFTTYVCLANPCDKAASVRVTYLRGDGTSAAQEVGVPGQSRVTLSVNDVLGSGDDTAHDVAITVEATNLVGIVAERPMYFDYHGALKGGHTTTGH
jgi:hypothetical protein